MPLQNDVADTTLSFFPQGSTIAEVAAPVAYKEESMRYNGALVPPSDIDYMQYAPNNKLLQFLDKAMATSHKDEDSFAKAKSQAKRLYEESILSGSSSERDNSLSVISAVVNDYREVAGDQAMQEVTIGLRELTAEQMLKVIDDNARMIKCSVNDRFQVLTTIFCCITTAITMSTLITSGPASAAPAVASQAGKVALNQFLKHVVSKIGAAYAGTLGRLMLVSEVAGDAVITGQEMAEVWSSTINPDVRADITTWTAISRAMKVTPTASETKILHRYILKPSEMIGLLAAWERGNRSFIDVRLRNLIYGRSAYFMTNQTQFSRVTFRTDKVGRDVERQLGTPSLFPAFSLMLRILGRVASNRLTPIAAPLVGGGLWLFRFKQFTENTK